VTPLIAKEMCPRLKKRETGCVFWPVTEISRLDAVFQNPVYVVSDRTALLKDLVAFHKQHEIALPETNKAQYAARQTFEPIAERLKGLIKQVDLLYKLVALAGQLAGELASSSTSSF
jgi:hypothetical protein